MALTAFGNFQEFDENLKRRGTRVGRRKGLQPVVFKDGVPSANNARPSGITNASILNLLAPQDTSGTGATGSADTAIQNSRRIKRDREVTKLLTTLGGQQLQEEASTGRATDKNIVDLARASLTDQASRDLAGQGSANALAKQGLVGQQKLALGSQSAEAALERLNVTNTAGAAAQARALEAGSEASGLEDARARRTANENRAFSLFQGGDVTGARSLASSGSFTPSFRGLQAPVAPSQLKFIPGQKTSGSLGQEINLPGKVFNPATGEVNTDLSDLSDEERDALLQILENRDTQGE